MLVLVMMDEARKPENWMWMGFNAEAPDEENQDTRVSPRLADLFGASDGCLSPISKVSFNFALSSAIILRKTLGVSFFVLAII